MPEPNPPIADPTSAPLGEGKPTLSRSDLGTTGTWDGETSSVGRTIRVGDTIACYKVIYKLGEGGMGLVFAAEDINLCRKVAIKMMKPEVAVKESHRERFLREARAAAAVEHDHIIPIYRVDQEYGVPYIVMPFLHGEPLDVRLKRQRLSLPEILSIGRQVAEGLTAAHVKGLIHRDIKPANIWLETGVTPHVKILDFGLARLSSDEGHLTQSGAILGTPAYMAPEQARGKEVDSRADLFSLGVMLYEMSTGQRPFTGPDAIGIMFSLANDTPTPPIELNPELPPIFSKLVERLLAKDREKRIGKAIDVADVLQRLTTENAVVVATPKRNQPNPFADIDVDSATNLGTPNRAGSTRDDQAGTPKHPAESTTTGQSATGRLRDPARMALVAIALMALAVGAFFAVRGGNKEEPKPDGTAKNTDVPKKIDPIPPMTTDELPKQADTRTPEEKQARELQASWAAKTKHPVEKPISIGMKMRLIPPGEPATVPNAFYMGTYEVTQAAWEKVMGYNPSREQGADRPVEHVTWFDCVEFCNKLSKFEGLKPYYELTVEERIGKSIEKAEVKILGGDGYKIPTDPEWTWACAAGAKTKYHFGDDVADLPRYAWFGKNSGWLHIGGGLKPNAFGLYDIHGNVCEWNEEILKNAMTGAPECVNRGGDWVSLASSCTVGTRSRHVPAYRNSFIGLRLAQVPSGEPPATQVELAAQKLQQDAAAKFKLPIETENKIGLKLCLIPPGEGVDKAFYMGKYEVTQGEWEAVMGYNPSVYKKGKKVVEGMDTSRFPVENISWYDSVEFCNKLSVREGLKPYYELTVKERKETSIEKAEVKILGGNGYKIPTDPEWTWACAAGAATKYHFGDDDAELRNYAWANGNAGGRTHDVGELKANAFGLYDFHGNVREWNEEILKNNDSGAPECVYRGGYWYSPASSCTVGSQYRLGPGQPLNSIGLRLAQVPSGEAPMSK